MKTSPQKLLASFGSNLLEAGSDEAGRGCLAGPVFAAAVILSPDCDFPGLDDSKKLTARQRQQIRKRIEETSVAWAIGVADNTEIDELNILNASFLAMHRAISRLAVQPGLLLIDGNRFKPYPGILHHCLVGGDAKYMTIAAASVLAKTHRDDYMIQIHKEFPHFGWGQNKGYPTPAHITALREYGPTKYHRRSFRPKSQLKLVLGT
ncbi:MAG: ribonuclease HII [Bacteroidales bacterium]|nr:ribonuclease HII [Bacteroidales bacterium]MDZ4203708.1 ribonuclease HII [Bacteroidales bacterium]